MKCEFGFFLTDHISAATSELPLTVVELWLIHNIRVDSNMLFQVVIVIMMI